MTQREQTIVDAIVHILEAEGYTLCRDADTTFPVSEQKRAEVLGYAAARIERKLAERPATDLDRLFAASAALMAIFHGEETKPRMRASVRMIVEQINALMRAAATPAAQVVAS